MHRLILRLLPAVICTALAVSVSAAAAPAAQDSWTRDDAAHLLRRAGFGGTPQQIDALYGLGKTAAVDYLVDGKQPAGVTVFEPAKLEDFQPGDPSEMRPKKEAVEKMREAMRNAKDDAAREQLKKQVNQQQNVVRRQEVIRITSWWVDRMVHTDHPLEEKMSLFWHGLFTSGIREVKNPIFLEQQNVLFHKQALGNYRELTHLVVHDPAMLRYLNADQNVKGKPNENLGRELMELFTMGEGQGYTENDIKEVARSLTGLAVLREDGASFRPRMHDDDPKTIFGKKGNFGPDEVVELIFSRPQPAEHLSERLWQYFGMPDPDKKDVDRIAAVLRSNNFEVKPALKAIFTSDSFYGERAKFSLIKSPMEIMVETVRSLGTPVAQPQALAIANNARQMGQALFQPPNVRGWPGGEHWITSATLFMRYNTMCNAVDGTFALPQGKNDKGDKIAKYMRQRRKQEMSKLNATTNPSEAQSESMADEAMTKDEMPTTEPATASVIKLPSNALATLFPSLANGASATQLVDAAVDRFLQRPLHPVKRDALVKVLGDAPLKFGDRKDEQKVRDMLGLLMSTPEYQVH